MNFEQMKVIWDSQDQRPMYAVDEAALHESIRRGSRSFRNRIVASHLAIVAAWVALATLYLVAPLTAGEHLHRLAAAAILLALAAGQMIGLRDRTRGEARFDDSIRGDLDLAIWRIDHDIGWARSLRRGYVPLFLVAISIDFAVRLTPAFAAVWAGAVVLVGVASWSLEAEIRWLYLPKKNRFQMIRDRLVASET
jgi:hypothetical protein